MPSDRLLDARQLGVPHPARLGMLEHRRDRPAVLALEPVQQRQPLLHLVEATWSRLDALGVAVQLVHEVLGLERQCADAAGERVELCVHAARGLQRGGGGRERERGAAAVLGITGQRADTGGGGGPQRLDVTQP